MMHWLMYLLGSLDFAELPHPRRLSFPPMSVVPTYAGSGARNTDRYDATTSEIVFGAEHTRTSTLVSRSMH